MLVDREHTIAYRAAREKYINTPGQLIHVPRALSRVSVSRTQRTTANTRKLITVRWSSLNKFTSRSAREGHACEFLPTRRPLSRRLGQLHEGQLPRDKPGGGRTRQLPAHTRGVSAPTHRRLLVGARTAGLPPLSPVSPRGGARRAVREGPPRAIGAGFGRGGRPQACGQQRGRALEAGQGPRGRAGS